METLDLVKELSTRPAEEIQYAFLQLMLKGKINHHDFNEAYIQFLEIEKKAAREEKYNILSLLGDFLIYKDKVEKATLDSALKALNDSKMFNMGSLNKKYNYD